MGSNSDQDISEGLYIFYFTSLSLEVSNGPFVLLCAQRSKYKKVIKFPFWNPSKPISIMQYLAHKKLQNFTAYINYH